MFRNLPALDNTTRRWLYLALAIHLITAWFSVGHHSADEYFQIFEFANFRLGGTPLHDMPVEYAEQMRSWVQPGLYYFFIRVLQSLGLSSPHAWARLIRIFMGVLGWLSGVGIVRCIPLWIQSQRAQKMGIALVAFLFCLPVLHVRPSSENFGGILFLLALTSVEAQRGASRKVSAGVALFAGILLEFAFEGRFQIGLMIAGLFLWWVFVAKMELRSVAKILAGFLIAFGISRVVDFWGYGDWCLSPWNYLRYNLIRGEVNRYGQVPWWDLYRMSITEAWPVLGILLALAIPLSWFLAPMQVVTWAQAPLFFVHEMIAHKELRFFFPIVLIAPVNLAWCYEAWVRFVEKRPQARLFGKAALWFFGLLNFSALFIYMILPLARNVQFQEGLSHFVPATGEFVLWIHERDPYENLGTQTHFYRPSNVSLKKLKNWKELRDASAQSPLYFFDTRFHLPEEAVTEFPALSQGCVAVYRTIPEVAEKLNFGNILMRVNIWTLFRCDLTNGIPKIRQVH